MNKYTLIKTSPIYSWVNAYRNISTLTCTHFNKYSNSSFIWPRVTFSSSKLFKHYLIINIGMYGNITWMGERRLNKLVDSRRLCLVNALSHFTSVFSSLFTWGRMLINRNVVTYFIFFRYWKFKLHPKNKTIQCYFSYLRGGNRKICKKYKFVFAYFPISASYYWQNPLI